MQQEIESVTLQLGDGHLTVPKDALMLTWLKSTLAASALAPAPAALVPPRIGSEWPGQAGIYVGVMRGADGAPDYHLFLLPGQADDVTWDQACAWSKNGGGELPTRREQRLLFANAQDGFEEAWYWSGEQIAAIPSGAWGQTFNGGDQDGNHKSNEGRARAVRRLIIQ